ncbi:MAG: hypothetical protein FHK81_03435 [Marinobacter vinifirmus]|uniref:Uncharacterized protein n=1 Tax=Marinobacter vinifirmus TaxID=355591 RepID=A0A558BG97_9GAMM|nr:MAG: hypothetical protein FHK81_03435 [Marinobacter vinifirmus]
MHGACFPLSTGLPVIRPIFPDRPLQAYCTSLIVASRVRRYRLIPLTEPYIRATYTAHAINLPRTRGQ